MSHSISAAPSLRLAASNHLFGVGLPCIIVDCGRLGKHRHHFGFRR